LSRDELTAVDIPSSLVKKIETLIKGTSFASVSSYVAFVISEAVAETERRDKPVFSKKDEDKVNERLRALGYVE